jgi:hypothetical protein
MDVVQIPQALQTACQAEQCSPKYWIGRNRIAENTVKAVLPTNVDPGLALVILSTFMSLFATDSRTPTWTNTVHPSVLFWR